MRNYLDDRPIKLRRERGNTPASLRPFIVALFLCVGAFVLTVVDRAGQTQGLRGALQQTLSPATVVMLRVRDQFMATAQAPWGDDQLRERIAVLEQRVSELEAELIDARRERAENAQLRAQLAITQRNPWRLLGAEVSVRSPDAGRRVLTIARGSNDGVEVGMPVIGQSGTNPAALVGIVESVGPRTADVLLITDFSSQISARILHDATSRLGLVQGQWQVGSRLRLTQLERDQPITVGDPVVTAGLTNMLDLPLALSYVPENIPIGIVEAVSSEGQVQVAELRPYVDPDQVRYIWVILNRDV